jgi:CHAT domain-containing protein
VDITAGRFFRAIGEFIDLNGTTASISSAGGSGGGAITIRHGGGSNNTPFIIGDATVNGTAASLTNGSTTLSNQVILESLTEGTISLLTEGDASLLSPETIALLGFCLPTCSSVSLERTSLAQDNFVQESISDNTARIAFNTGTTVAITIIEQSEIHFTREFLEFLDLAEISDKDDFDDNDFSVDGSNSSDESNNFNDFNALNEREREVRSSDIETEIRRLNEGESSNRGNNFNALNDHEGEVSSRGIETEIRQPNNSNSRDDDDESELSPSETVTEIRRQLGNVKALSDLQAALVYITFGQREAQGVLGAPQLDSDRLELVLATGQGDPIYVPMPSVTRKQVQLMAQRFRRHVSTPSFADTDSYLFSSQQLYQWLIAPLEDQLQGQGIDTIGFVVEAGLRSLPFAALHDGERFLVEKYNFSMIPSLNLTNLDYVPLQTQAALVGGSTEFLAQPTLPTAGVEVNTIQSLWPGQQLQEQDFKLETLKNERQQRSYGIIHLATHGEFSRGALENSYVQFADQKLRLDQIRELNWHDPPVELVTLSACQTALGNQEAEMGFAGLALLAGAKSALASLWSVSDSATTGLMIQFYQNLRDGGHKAESLQQAQRSLLNNQVWIEGEQLHWSNGSVSLPPDVDIQRQLDFSHPFYWSAFTMIGSPW